jgi:DNA-binding protein Fis
VARGVAARAAAAIGIPETTFRRRRSKASADAQAGMAPRPTSWQDVQRVLAGLIRSPRANGEDLLRKSQSLLLDAVLDRVPGDVKTGARLLGVTPPTFRRRVATTRPGAPRRETS